MKAFAVAAVLAVAFVAAFPTTAGSSATNTVTVTDPAGDAGTGPDLTALTFSDSATGTLQFSFTVSSMGNDTGIYVFMDTDRNQATGSASGSEYEVELTVDSSGKRWYDVTRWNGTDWVSVPESSSMGMSVSGSTWTLRAGKSDLGSTTAFTYFVATGLFDANSEIIAGDRAPDTGSLVYELSTARPPTTTTTPAAAVVPWIGKATISPAPRAGAVVTVTFPVTERASGAPLLRGTMTCDPHVAGKVLAHHEAFGNGHANLRFTIPKTAKGKQLKVNLTIRVGAKSAHTVVLFTVR